MTRCVAHRSTPLQCGWPGHCGIVTVCMCLHQLGGYVATFDLRDPGSYTLQVLVGAYFGDAEPMALPLPITVGSHVVEFSLCNVARALVDRARYGGMRLVCSVSRLLWVSQCANHNQVWYGRQLTTHDLLCLAPCVCTVCSVWSCPSRLHQLAPQCLAPKSASPQTTRVGG